MRKLFSSLRPEVVALLILIGFEVYLIASSEGFYYIDEGAHFVDDYLAFRHPSISMGVWQRFGSVWIFMVPAQFGPVAVKIFASLLFLLTIFITYKVAELEQLPFKEWIIVLVGFQPVFLDISFTCLAELPATFFLVLAYYFYKKSSWRLSLSFASLVFLCRYEMSFLAILLFLIAYRRRKYYALPYAVIGPALWFGMSWIWTGDPTWLVTQFVNFGNIPKFIEGTTWYHYLKHSTDIFGTIQVWLVVASLLFAVYKRRMTIAIPLAIVLWSVLFNTLASAKSVNWTPSVGDFRYLVTVAPFVGLLALDGLSGIMELLRQIQFARAVPSVLALIMIYSTINAVHPHHLSTFENAVIVLTQRAGADSTNVPILSNHWASQFALMDKDDEIDRIEVLRKQTYLENPREYILWDSQIANSVFSQLALAMEDVKNDPNTTLVDSINVGYGSVYLFRRAADEGNQAGTIR